MRYFSLFLGSSALLLSACGGGGGSLEEPTRPGPNNTSPVYKSISLSVNNGAPQRPPKPLRFRGLRLIMALLHLLMLSLARLRVLI